MGDMIFVYFFANFFAIIKKRETDKLGKKRGRNKETSIFLMAGSTSCD